jgi:hypothetical protein
LVQYSDNSNVADTEFVKNESKCLSAQQAFSLTGGEASRRAGIAFAGPAAAL